MSYSVVIHFKAGSCRREHCVICRMGMDMITEAVLINELSDNDTLNSRSEWNYVKLPNVAITRN